MTANAQAPAWSVRVATLFPEMFPGPLGLSLAGKALDRGDWVLETVDIRAFARDKHRSVDDTPFGGGAGMVMRPDVVDAALCAARWGQVPKGTGRSPGTVLEAGRVVYLTPRGRVFDQAMARSLLRDRTVVLLCGRYEGVDQRVLDAHDVEEVSLGDFVLSGGEPAALCVIDAVVRLLPGVMGNEDSAGEESFGEGSGTGLLEYPHYTRPAVWAGHDGVERTVPEVLVSGHHAKVERWRRDQAERATRDRRPDLWARRAAHGAGGSGQGRI
ncbi:MAG: tRNA (guanosine(37)-N1)-methyltransferase TrmD [Inquilinaceae bacterium]